MKTYRVKGKGASMTYVQIVEEREDEFHLIVTRQIDGEQRVSRDRISKHLFTVCLETGYLIEEKSPVLANSELLSA